jgi:hypothetical protein
MKKFKNTLKRDIEYGDRLYKVVICFSAYYDREFKNYEISDWDIESIIELDEYGNEQEVKLEWLPKELQQKIDDIEPNYEEMSEAEQGYKEAQADNDYERLREKQWK